MNPAIRAGIVSTLCLGLAHAAPYVPRDDRAVLERLPAKATDPQMAELQRLRAAAAAAPDDEQAVSRLARRYFELAMAEGDPRYIGYAEVALGRWRASSAAPVTVLVVRALLRQFRHEFALALTDFSAALQHDPENAEARSWRAAILMVQAEYAKAREECEALALTASELLATGCSSYVDSLTGFARPAYARLLAALERRPDASAELRLWVLTRLAEMAWRLGETDAAERHFREALALGVTDHYLLSAYADFLLARQRPREVLALLEGRASSDSLLLLLAIAERALGRPGAGRHARELAERFAAANLRGEGLHLQDEARFLLELRGDARAALAVALENWKTQREPADAAAVLEAALAARDPRAAAPVLDWLERSGFEGLRLRRLAAALQALPK